METAVFLAILESVTEIIQSRVGGKTGNVAVSIEKLIGAGLTAYQQETGQPLDAAKIKPFTPIA
jgi:hypothetical protein